MLCGNAGPRRLRGPDGQNMSCQVTLWTPCKSHMDLAQCATRPMAVVGGGANPPGSPGLLVRRLQPLLDAGHCSRCPIHPLEGHAHYPSLALPCVHILTAAYATHLHALQRTQSGTVRCALQRCSLGSQTSVVIPRIYVEKAIQTWTSFGD